MILLRLLVAHQLHTSYVDIVESGETLTLTLDLDPHDTPMARRIDANQDGVLAAGEIALAEQTLVDFAFGSLQAADGRARCVLSDAAGTWDAPQRVWRALAHFRCPAPAKMFTLYFAYLDGLPREHRALVRVTSDGVLGTQTVLRRGEALLDARQLPWWRFLVMGAEHIATGWDHLAFVAALLLGVTELRGVIIALTAFTLAHSLTLALAWLGVFTLPSRIVEPIIALSIAVVAIENLRADRSLRLRTALAFAFGLIHGMGFAGALEGAHFAPGTLVWSLATFNVGVELAQIVIVVVVWPLSTRLGKRRKWASLALTTLGLVWALERVI